MVFTIEGYLEVAIESWLEWDIMYICIYYVWDIMYINIYTFINYIYNIYIMYYYIYIYITK